MSNYGFLNLLKPPGMTSFDVIRALRSYDPSLKKLGHSGTLDLPACGVLVLAADRATKFLPYLLEEKEYLFELAFGLETDTGDAWGKIVRESGKPIDRAALEASLQRFQGPIVQNVPTFSAKHQDGKRLYQMAVRNEEPSKSSTSEVCVHSLRLLDFRAGASPCARLWIQCSGGTYVRALARDIGQAMNSAACARFIVRLRSSCFRLEESTTMEKCARGTIPLIPIETALGHLPLEILPDRDLASFANGKPVPASLTSEGELFRVRDRRNHFLGVGKRKSEHFLVAERLLG